MTLECFAQDWPIATLDRYLQQTFPSGLFAPGGDADGETVVWVVDRASGLLVGTSATDGPAAPANYSALAARGVGVGHPNALLSSSAAHLAAVFGSANASRWPRLAGYANRTVPPWLVRPLARNRSGSPQPPRTVRSVHVALSALHGGCDLAPAAAHGESKRPGVESSWSQCTSDCQRV
jgi:hypothetical protein